MSSCCPEPGTSSAKEVPVKKKLDYLLLLTSFVVLLSCVVKFSGIFADAGNMVGSIYTFSAHLFELLGIMWWGVLAGIFFVGLLSSVPREFIISILGSSSSGISSIIRATGAGVLLDLCSHGILMVGMKLYERGASLGQVMAFLIASPWNSFSLTLILWSLIGWKWTLTYILLSMVIAVISGLIFDRLVSKGTLPENSNKIDLPEGFVFWPECKKGLKSFKFTGAFYKKVAVDGFLGSRIILRWIFVGAILSSLIKTFISTHHLQDYFGATLLGLIFTLIVTTIIEVCSEGSTPIAADLLVRAKAPGNSFVFLMAGVSTDYTEVMVIKDTMKSWKIALFLPLITVPQIVVLGYLINQFSV